MTLSELTDVRRTNLRAIIDERFQGNRAAMCRATGKNQNLINLVLSANPKVRRNIGEKLARDIEGRLGLSRGWLDAVRDGSADEADCTVAVSTLAALGDGGPERLVLPKAVVASWLAGAATADLRAVHMPSDDMRPTIEPGDLMLVDVGATAIDRDGVYAIAHGTGVFVRRVKRLLTGGVRVVADRDPDEPVELKLDEVAARGRVVSVLRAHRS